MPPAYDRTLFDHPGTARVLFERNWRILEPARAIRTPRAHRQRYRASSRPPSAHTSRSFRALLATRAQPPNAPEYSLGTHALLAHFGRSGEIRMARTLLARHSDMLGYSRTTHSHLAHFPHPRAPDAATSTISAQYLHRLESHRAPSARPGIISRNAVLFRATRPIIGDISRSLRHPRAPRPITERASQTSEAGRAARKLLARYPSGLAYSRAHRDIRARYLYTLKYRPHRHTRHAPARNSTRAIWTIWIQPTIFALYSNRPESDREARYQRDAEYFLSISANDPRRMGSSRPYRNFRALLGGGRESSRAPITLLAPCDIIAQPAHILNTFRRNLERFRSRARFSITSRTLWYSGPNPGRSLRVTRATWNRTSGISRALHRLLFARSGFAQNAPRRALLETTRALEYRRAPSTTSRTPWHSAPPTARFSGTLEYPSYRPRASRDLWAPLAQSLHACCAISRLAPHRGPPTPPPRALRSHLPSSLEVSRTFRTLARASRAMGYRRAPRSPRARFAKSGAPPGAPRDSPERPARHGVRKIPRNFRTLPAGPATFGPTCAFPTQL